MTAGCRFESGKLWPQARSGLGVELDPAGAELVEEITEGPTPIPLFFRPDGSLTNWWGGLFPLLPPSLPRAGPPALPES